ncbi:MAG: S8 family peptidase [Firmicutes bacterium]|nr:S8 family peptidase [Bacillota bacterium]
MTYNTDKTVSVLLYNSRQVLGINQLHKQGLLGQNITIAIIDTGAAPHPDFTLGQNRIIQFVDLINNRTMPYDDNGHGTFTAGILAGNGLISGGRYCGIAPLSELIVIKALDARGQTEPVKIIEAMQWIYQNQVKFNIKVVCMSFGSPPLARADPLILGAESLWDSGIVVVTAGGNDGPEPNTIKSPGLSRKIITVGAASFDKETGNCYASDFSSRGSVYGFVKPDLIAPGVDIISTSNDLKFYTKMSGTSVATPFVAGVAALLLERRPGYDPNQIKSVLLHSATRLDCPLNTCGMGLLNPLGAVE